MIVEPWSDGASRKRVRRMIMAEYIRGKPLPYLKSWRLRKNLVQSELAQMAGVTKGTMARAERGDEVVSFANIRKIAEALGVSTDELLTKEPEEAEPDSDSCRSNLWHVGRIVFTVYSSQLPFIRQPARRHLL